MALSKSQITSKLKKNGLQCYPLGNTSFYVPAKDPKQTLNTILGMFMVDGGKMVEKSKHSAYGVVKVGNYLITSTPLRYIPAQPRSLPGENDSVKNRLAFSVMVAEVLHRTLKPLTIVFDGGKKVTINNVTGIKFAGKGIADFTIFQGTKPIPLAVHRTRGNYRHGLTGRYLDLAYDALEKVTTEELIDAEMQGDVMTLNAAIVFPADTRSVRELMFQDITGGLGIVGDFHPTDFVYDGKKNTLTIKCARAYESPVDLKSNDKPYFAIINSRTGQIGELKGLQVDLVPKNGLPGRMVLTQL